MAVGQFQMLHLGSLADMDTNENNNFADNAVSVLGGKSFGSNGDPLFSHSTQVTMIDADDNGRVDYDHYNSSTTDRVNHAYTTNGQPTKLDSVAIVHNVSIVRATPTGLETVTATVRIIQDAQGNTFLSSPIAGPNAYPTEVLLTEYPIVSIKLPTDSSNYSLTPSSNGTYSGHSMSRQSLPFQDGYVDGTDGNNLINGNYIDADGDRVDANDQILPGATTNQDYIRAGLGDDTVHAGAAADFVEGGDGNDVLYGHGPGSVDDNASDTLVGGAGDDTLFGNGGDDSLSGGDGSDRLDGGAGNDTLLGGAGDDTMRGVDGDDKLNGGDGNDSIDGNNGNDTIEGDLATGGIGGDDTLNGNTGDDSIMGYGGNDVISAGQGNDTVYGGAGNDNITGNTGADYIDGGAGNDTLEGGFGGAASTESENDTLIGGAGDDSINANVGDDSITGDAGRDSISAGEGNDTAHGGTENDTVWGNNGDDFIYGDAGNDTVSGGGDNDFVSGGDGNDYVYGDNTGSTSTVTGDDTLMGDAGDDTLAGGYGRDLLDGGEGSDLMMGGEGFDTFIAGEGDTISDFNTAAGQNIDDDNQSNNDFVDLSGYYNQTNLDAYNAQALANGQDTYGNPLAWLRADQDDSDGKLSQAGLNMTITGVTGGDLTHDNTNVICFGSDAMIRTASGDVAAKDLAIGDLVLTSDAGIQPIRWIGRRTLDAARLAANPKLRPIRIRKGALGAGLPEADLIVSPQHRMLVRSRIALKMFGTMEVLVAARQLCQIEGIDVAEDLAEVTYVHFMFDAHQIVLANGAEAESLYTGAEALKSVGPSAMAEIFAIFPELAAPELEPVAARTLTSGRLGRKLVVRHSQNDKPLVM